jgi:hypothetical protein
MDSAFVFARTTLRGEMQYEERRRKTVRPIATTRAAQSRITTVVFGGSSLGYHNPGGFRRKYDSETDA